MRVQRTDLDIAIRNDIRTYFDGNEYTEERNAIQENLFIAKLGITDIQVVENTENVTVTITLLRPGFLIGKAGCEINNLQKYLSQTASPKTLKLCVRESDLWSRWTEQPDIQPAGDPEGTCEPTTEPENKNLGFNFRHFA